jgi:hypothetical protein
LTDDRKGIAQDLKDERGEAGGGVGADEVAQLSVLVQAAVLLVQPVQDVTVSITVCRGTTAVPELGIGDFEGDFVEDAEEEVGRLWVER